MAQPQQLIQASSPVQLKAKRRKFDSTRCEKITALNKPLSTAIAKPRLPPQPPRFSSMNTLFSNFITVFEAVAQIGVVILLAGWLVRRNIIPAGGVKLISDIVINVFLPCLIFSNILVRFQPSKFTGWWLLPLSATLLLLVGWSIAQILFCKAGEARRELIPLAFLQNAAYLVLPIGKIILKEDFDQFALYCFLILLANNPLLWLIGKHYLRRRETREVFKWQRLLSPPIYANIIALTLVITNLRDFVPSVITETASFLGEGAIPIATFALGASLGSINLNFRRYLKPGSLVILQKLFLIPAAILGIMAFVPWLRSDPILILLFTLQAASAPATSLILQSSSYSDNSERVGTIIVMCYIVCIISIPLWVAIAQALYG